MTRFLMEVHHKSVLERLSYGHVISSVQVKMLRYDWTEEEKQHLCPLITTLVKPLNVRCLHPPHAGVSRNEI